MEIFSDLTIYRYDFIFSCFREKWLEPELIVIDISGNLGIPPSYIQILGIWYLDMVGPGSVPWSILDFEIFIIYEIVHFLFSLDFQVPP
jgi:hypothetical protein